MKDVVRPLILSSGTRGHIIRFLRPMFSGAYLFRPRPPLHLGSLSHPFFSAMGREIGASHRVLVRSANRTVGPHFAVSPASWIDIDSRVRRGLASSSTVRPVRYLPSSPLALAGAHKYPTCEIFTKRLTDAGLPACGRNVSD